jgi:hypothetical protein
MIRQSLFLLALAAAPAFSDSIILNGGFESNGGTGSSTFTDWTVVSEAGGGGSWYVQTGTTSPLNGFPVTSPTEGTYAAMTDAGGPSSQVLLQSFTVPVGAISISLSFDYFLNNLGPDYVPGTDLDSPNQQARVDILTSGAGAFDVGASVVDTVFQTQSGDPLQPGAYQTLTVDLTGVLTPGASYQLRFAEVDDLGELNFGVDNVQLDVVTPEPAAFAFTALGLSLLAGRVLGKRA